MTMLILSTTLKNKLQQIGYKLKGLDYLFGAEVDLSLSIDDVIKNKTKFDCSEMIEWLYYKIGIRVPDGSYNQFNASTDIDEDTTTIGDLVFKKRDNKICHVGMIIETKPSIMILEADGYSKKIIEKPFENFKYTPNPKQAQYAGLRRFLREKVKIFSRETIDDEKTV